MEEKIILTILISIPALIFIVCALGTMEEV